MNKQASAMLLVATVVTFAAQAVPALATFPGSNGQIAFTGPDSAGQPRQQIFGLSPDGTKRADLTQFNQENRKADWTADGAKIAFSSAPSGSNGPGPEQIWTMNADGSARTQITSDNHDNDAPSWSPDGSKIAYVANSNGPDYSDVFVIPSTGGTPTNLTNMGSFGIADAPDWSPDGSKIAYAGRNGPDYDVFTVPATGGTSTNLTNDAAEDRDPSWSPDGSKIAYASKGSGAIFHIWVMNADGTSKTQLSTGTSNDFNPSWSPDGTKIAFDRGCPNDDCTNGQGTPQNGDIWVMDAAGTNLANLTNDGAPEYQPDWGTNTNDPTGPVCNGCGGGPSTIDRSITLKLSGHLSASGDVVTNGEEFKACFASMPVKIQKRSGTWKTIKSTTTSSKGHYSVGLPNRSGKYRALAPETQGGGATCGKATSPTRAYHK